MSFAGPTICMHVASLLILLNVNQVVEIGNVYLASSAWVVVGHCFMRNIRLQKMNNMPARHV